MRGLSLSARARLCVCVCVCLCMYVCVCLVPPGWLQKPLYSSLYLRFSSALFSPELNKNRSQGQQGPDRTPPSPDLSSFYFFARLFSSGSYGRSYRLSSACSPCYRWCSARRKMCKKMVKCWFFIDQPLVGGMSHKTIRPITTSVIKMLSPIVNSNSKQWSII